MNKARSADSKETAEQLPDRTATAQAPERAVQRSREDRNAEPPQVRMTGVNDFSRARPGQKPVEVTRSWPGVRNGQLVVLHPAHQKRLLKGGFVKELR